MAIRSTLIAATGILLLAIAVAPAKEPSAPDSWQRNAPGRDPAARKRFLTDRATLLNDRAPAAAAKYRFLDHGDYVEDKQTGLLWQKDGKASGKKNFYEAAEYAKTLTLGGLTGWRVPTAAELAAIFPADREPFTNSGYTTERCCAGPTEYRSYWTSELDARLEDYAYAYQWYAKGGPNNCFASKNYVYVRCVRGVGEAAAPMPVAKLDDETLARVRKLIDDLGHEDFAVRESAAAELKAQGAAIRTLLEEALKNNQDAETRYRLKLLLDG